MPTHLIEENSSVPDRYRVVDPASARLVSSHTTASDDDIDAVLRTAGHAIAAWAPRSQTAERARLLVRIAQLHDERRDELAAIITREMGKPREQARAEVEFSADIYRYYAQNADAILADEPLPLSSGGTGTAFVRRSALGVILGIMPWNYPYYQVARFAAPNLLVGNAVVIKPAPQCPESAAALQSIMRDAGLPTGAYSTVLATDEQVAEMIADPIVRGVSVTGSERAGAAVAEVAGRNLKKVVLELGGSDPFIVLGTDDLDATVRAAAGARLENSGQACNAAKRFIVHADVYDSFLVRFQKQLRLMGAVLGPLSSDEAARRLDTQLTRAVEQGAHYSSAGHRDGAWFPPGVLTNVTADLDVYREELFGPVAMVFKVHSESEAISLANDTPYGLGSYVFTPDPDQAIRVAEQLEVGMVFINGVGADAPELPFGGVRRSGFGRELGRFGADEFVNKKLIRTVA